MKTSTSLNINLQCSSYAHSSFVMSIILTPKYFIRYSTRYILSIKTITTLHSTFYTLFHLFHDRHSYINFIIGIYSIKLTMSVRQKMTLLVSYFAIFIQNKIGKIVRPIALFFSKSLNPPLLLQRARPVFLSELIFTKTAKNSTTTCLCHSFIYLIRNHAIG